MGIREINRRSMSNKDEGMACGPVKNTVIDTEIVVDDNGKNVYLHGQWIDETAIDIMIEATQESVYDVYERIHAGEDGESMMKEIERIRESIIDENVVNDRYSENIDDLIIMTIDEIQADELYDQLFPEEDREDGIVRFNVSYR